MTLRVVFAGTPEFALPCFDTLHRLHCAGEITLLGCYTQPDRPAGRGQKTQPSPIKQRALTAQIPVFTPESLKDSTAQAELAALAPDLLVVVAYGQILPKRVLAMPKHGCWNIHASLLPRWRGAAPIQRAIAAGDAQTGVCLMQMRSGLDTGPVLLSESEPIHADDTAASLHDRLSELGASVLANGLKQLLAATLPVAMEQPAEGVSYAHKLEKSEAPLNFQRSALALSQTVRAFLPYPLTETLIAGERVQILRAEAVASAHSCEPGTLLQADKHGILIACADGALRISQLKAGNGKVLSAAEFVNGRPHLKASLGTA